MSKSNFLLVDLNETKTQKLAETITSTTSRKILNYLTEKDHDTEASIAKELGMPISTVHYHMQKLVEAKLIVVDEFHYSKKGREVNHYKLANKYIIIAPKKISGLREKLKGILPVFMGAVGISAVIKFVFEQDYTFTVSKSIESDMIQAAPMVAEKSADLARGAAPMMATESTEVISNVGSNIVAGQPDIALWFLLGSSVTIILYLVFAVIREKLKKQ